MSRQVQLIIAGAVVVVLAAGAMVLLSWDIPAPSEQVTKTLDDDRFPT